jgi:AhpD family alkylhydroperoxidase
MMNSPLDAAPVQMKEWIRAGIAISAGFDPVVAELVKIRASQINGCANCINLHVTEARAAGETEQRLQLLAAWDEAPCYSERERAALAWTEALARLSERRDRTEALAELVRHFSDQEQLHLTLLINVITGFNRISVGFGLYADPAAIKAGAASVEKDCAKISSYER